MSTDWVPSRPAPSLPRRAAGMLQRLLPMLVWLAAVGLLFWLHASMPRSMPLSGLVESPQATVVSPVAGRVSALLVSLHQEVEADQLVARVQVGGEQQSLLAPMRGRVASIVHLGEWMHAGQTVVTIVEPVPQRIVAYAPEATGGVLAAAQSVRIARLDHTVLGSTTIQSVSPAVVRLPERLWRDARQEEWGYEVIVAPTGHEHPGERVQVLAGQ